MRRGFGTYTNGGGRDWGEGHGEREGARKEHRHILNEYTHARQLLLLLLLSVFSYVPIATIEYVFKRQTPTILERKKKQAIDEQKQKQQHYPNDLTRHSCHSGPKYKDRLLLMLSFQTLLTFPSRVLWITGAHLRSSIRSQRRRGRQHLQTCTAVACRTRNRRSSGKLRLGWIARCKASHLQVNKRRKGGGGNGEDARRRR